jgi:hypothetical protein
VQKRWIEMRKYSWQFYWNCKWCFVQESSCILLRLAMSCVILGARSICIYLIHMIVGKCVSSDVQDSLQHTAFDKGYFTSSS